MSWRTPNLITFTSSNPAGRLECHNSFRKGFASRYRSYWLAFTKEFSSRQEAHAAETKVKGWKSRKMIGRLIGGEALL